jgi:hypothetical protein
MLHTPFAHLVTHGSCGLIRITPTLFILSAVESSPHPSQLNEVLSERSAVQLFKLIFQFSRPPVIFPTQRFCDDLSPIHKPNQILRLFVNYHVTMPQQSKL